MTVKEAINLRRSIRRYKNKDLPVPQEKIDALLDAAMKAPSACNSRPWSFVVVRTRQVLDTIAAKHASAKMLADAQMAIIVCGLPDLQKGALSEGYMPQDCAASTQNILLCAYELGLGTCWCGVYPNEKNIRLMREILGDAIPPDAVPFNIIAVGESDETLGARGWYEKGKVTYV
jgi:nitroreductase